MATKSLITLSAQCDISQAERLHEELEAACKKSNKLDVDASAVEKVDTSTLQLLLAMSKYLDDSHGQLTILDPSESFSAIATLLGISPLLNVQSTNI